jgi:uroporphyrinogen decarboxylase
MIPKRKYPADFEQLARVLRRETPDRPVLFEYFVNAELISFFNGRPFEAAATPEAKIRDIIGFFHKAGYDYATIPSRYFGGFSFTTADHEKKATVSQNEGCVITDRSSFENYIWPNPEQGDFGLLDKMALELNDGMKFVISAPGGLLENVTSLVGFENLCFMIYEDEELSKAIFDEVGSRLLRFYEICSSIPVVGALIVNDDWGFKTQTMLAPEMLRELVFPWHKKMVEAIHCNRKFAILHSCGNLEAVMDDVVFELKYDAKHSFEDIIIPVEDFWQQWHKKIAVLGGIDVDFLARSTPELITKRCRKILETTGLQSYALGSGNSITGYIPIENYLAIIDTATEI